MAEIDSKIETRLAEAEACIAKLTAELHILTETRTTLTAPFRVVDEHGKLLLEANGIAGERSLRVFNANGEVVSSIGGDGTDGGWIHVMSTRGNFSVTLGSDPHGGWLDIHNAKGDRQVITLTATADGGNIEVSDSNGNLLFDAVDAGRTKHEQQTHGD